MGWYLILWGLTVPVTFALGIGMFGSTIAQGLESLLEGAAEGEPVTLGMLLSSVPLLLVPYWLWLEVGHRS